MIYNLLKKWGYYLALLWMIVIIVLLVMPAKDIPSSSILERIHFDKFVHFTLFGTLVALWTIPYADRHTPSQNTRFFLLVCLGACLFGAGMEVVQLKFTKDRDYENGDIVADSIGAIVFMIISMIWVKAERHKKLNGKPS
jgi:VanZ family protein